MRKKVLFLMCLLLVAGATQAALFQHLDATRADSVILGTEVLDPADPNIVLGYSVSTWNDLSGNGRDATVDIGVVTYPSVSMAAGGFSGVDFGPSRNRMNLGPNPYLNQLPDPADPNTPKGGWSILVALQFDQTGVDSEFLGTNSVAGSGVGMKANSSRTLQTWLGLPNVSGGKVDDGDTVVVGLTYRNAGDNTGTRHFYDSIRDNTTVTDTGPSDKSTTGGLYLGSVTNAGRYLRGSIGELKIYDAALSAEDLEYQIDLLNRKWTESRVVYPLDTQGVAANTSLPLQWNNLLPDTQGNDVYVDVYFGTDPNRLLMDKVLDNAVNATTVNVDASSIETVYYWAVDTNFVDEPNDIRDIQGPFYSFSILSDPPPGAVEAGPDWSTWVNEPVTITATVDDQGDSDVTVTFSSPDPNLVFSPNPVVIAGGGGDVVTTATIDYHATTPDDITVTVTAEDALNTGMTVSDTITLTVYATACEAARLGQDGIANNPEDLVLDGTSACVIDLADFAAIAAKWLENYEAKTAFEIPAP